jgi:CBS domain-containing protein
MTFRDVLVAMVQKKLKRVPVIDEKSRLLGVVSRSDLLHALFDDNKKA